MRVMNEKVKAPTAADSQFKTEEEAAPEAGADAFPDAGGFVLPGDEAPADAAAPAAAEAAAEAAPAADEGVILQQVLGSEKINVFLRIDILQFLEAPKA
jgi:hypothetical protein